LGHLAYRGFPFGRSGLAPQVRLPSGLTGPGIPLSLLGQDRRLPGDRGPHDRMGSSLFLMLC